MWDSRGSVVIALAFQSLILSSIPGIISEPSLGHQAFLYPKQTIKYTANVINRKQLKFQFLHLLLQSKWPISKTDNTHHVFCAK